MHLFTRRAALAFCQLNFIVGFKFDKATQLGDAAGLGFSVDYFFCFETQRDANTNRLVYVVRF